MTLRLVAGIENNATFCLALDGFTLVALFARPLRDHVLWSGDICAAQVQRYAPAQRAYILDAGGGRIVFAPHADGKLFTSGGRVTIQIARAATRDKDARAIIIDDQPATRGASPIELARAKYPDATMVDDPVLFDDTIGTLQDLQSPHVSVQNGLSVMIEETAALTAIDINNADPSLHGLQANMAAWHALQHHITLRQLGGQIMIDFLRLKNVHHRRQLHDTITNAAPTIGITPYGFTRLGLFEMTRTRDAALGGLSLAEFGAQFMAVLH